MPVYKQTVVNEEDKAELLEVVRLEQNVIDQVAVRKSIFHSRSKILFIKRFILIQLVKCAELFFGKLYKTNLYQDYRFLSPETRNTLISLKEDELLQSWRANVSTPGIPRFNHVVMVPEPIRPPSGREYTMGGTSGSGAGYSTEEAMLPAAGEFIERLATAWWWERDDIQSQKVGFDTRAIDPKKFDWLTSVQKKATQFNDKHFDFSQPLHWMPAMELRSRKKCYVPAQLVYHFFGHDHPEEPFIWDASSNGAGAHVTYEKALYSALTETIERDAFMIVWHHKKLPRHIDYSSLREQKPLIAEYLELLKKRGVSISVLDCTSDIGLPVVVVVTCDPNGNGVMVSSSCDHDVYAATEKSIIESAKFLQGSMGEQPELVEEYRAGTIKINTLTDRYRLWSQVGMISEIQWLLASKEFVTLDQLANENAIKNRSVSENLHDIYNRLADCNIDMYAVDVTTSFSKKYNLYVVKTLSPDMVQVYFGEWEKPVFNRRLRYDSDGNEVTLNTVPHPFV